MNFHKYLGLTNTLKPVIARHNKFETSDTRNIQPFLQDLLEYTKVQKNKIPRSK